MTNSSKTEKLSAVVVENITSPEERKNGSMHYVLVTPAKDILTINVDENLRAAYTSEESVKKKTPIHKEILDSFDSEPNRFIQRHSGFTVVCDEINISSRHENGLSTVTLINASLINGAQTQHLLQGFFDTNKDNPDCQETNIRVEVIVEKDVDERTEIAIARNSSINVAELSKMGKHEYFEDLDKSMRDFNNGWGIAKSETDDLIPTQRLLQVIRTMIPKEVRDQHKLQKDNVVKSYSGRIAILKEFKEMIDKQKEGEKENKDFKSDILNFFISFAPIAWQEYQKWAHDKDWIKHYNKPNFKRIGTYNKKTGEFELAWAIACPLLYGLQHYIYEDEDGWKIKYSPKFDKKAYMKCVLDGFKQSGYVPQDFAKLKSNYQDLWIFLLGYK